MRLGTAILALAAAVWLGGCSGKKPKTVAAAPPPPAPVVVKPAEPLSIPQTSVELPPPQPVPPESLPPPEPGTPPPPPPAVPRSNSRPSRPGSQQPARTEPVTPVGPPAPTPAPEPERPPIVEALPPVEAKRLQDEMHSRVQETKQLMSRISVRRLRQQASLRQRIDSFLSQAEEAERRNDMRQASELAGRALLLARELRP